MIIVAGIGTDVGKTVVSAILVTALQGDYWKPIQCGAESDSETIQKLTDGKIHKPAYSLKAPLSPHHAARLEGISIHPESILPPKTERPLIVEGVGGIFVPLRTDLSSIDLFAAWNAKWVIVSKHYLGSINHTLLTLDALKRKNVEIAGLIFNGEPNPDTEAAIIEIGQVPLLGRVFPEKTIDRKTIEHYAKQSNLASLYPDANCPAPHSDRES